MNLKNIKIKKQGNIQSSVLSKFKDHYLNERFAKYNLEIKRLEALDLARQIAILFGDIQSDGSLGLDLKITEQTKAPGDSGYTLNPYFSMTQKTSNEVVLVLLAYFFRHILELASIPRIETRDTGEKSVKGDVVQRVEYRWSGKGFFKDLLNLFDQAREIYGYTLHADKLFDELLLRKILECQTMNIGGSKQSFGKNPHISAKVLDLRLSLHQPDKNSRKDLPTFAQNRKSREQWEKDLLLTEAGVSSVNAAKSELQEVDAKYSEYLKNLEQQISNHSLVVHPMYISNVFQGDGSLGISIWKESFLSRQKKNPLHIHFTLSIVGTLTSMPLFQIVQYYFNFENVYFYTSRDKKGTLNFSVGVKEMRKRLVFLNHFEFYPLFMKPKQERYQLFMDLHKMGFFERDFELSRKDALIIVERIYNLEGQGTERTISFESMIKRIKKFYKKFFYIL